MYDDALGPVLGFFLVEPMLTHHTANDAVLETLSVDRVGCLKVNKQPANNGIPTEYDFFNVISSK